MERCSTSGWGRSPWVPVWVRTCRSPEGWIAPWHAPYYSAFRPWPDPWLYNRGYYDLYFPRWRVALPSKQMLELAIPEGVVESGGSVTGFLYFSEIPRAVDRVTFVAKLVDGHTEETFGTIEIPLVR